LQKQCRKLPQKGCILTQLLHLRGNGSSPAESESRYCHEKNTGRGGLADAGRLGTGSGGRIPGIRPSRTRPSPASPRRPGRRGFPPCANASAARCPCALNWGRCGSLAAKLTTVSRCTPVGRQTDFTVALYRSFGTIWTCDWPRG